MWLVSGTLPVYIPLTGWEMRASSFNWHTGFRIKSYLWPSPILEAVYGDISYLHPGRGRKAAQPSAFRREGDCSQWGTSTVSSKRIETVPPKTSRVTICDKQDSIRESTRHWRKSERSSVMIRWSLWSHVGIWAGKNTVSKWFVNAYGSDFSLKPVVALTLIWNQQLVSKVWSSVTSLTCIVTPVQPSLAFHHFQSQIEENGLPLILPVPVGFRLSFIFKSLTSQNTGDSFKTGSPCL